MDATRISFDTATPLEVGPPHAGSLGRGHDTGDTLAKRWEALQAAAGVVGILAGAMHDPQALEMDDFPAAIRSAPPALRDWAEQSVEDLAAIMEPGLAALIAVHASGGDAGAPARALWHEFITARDALLGPVLIAD